MARQEQQLHALGRIADRRVTMALRVLEAADGAGEEVSERVALCLWLGWVAERAGGLVERLPHERRPDVGVGEPALGPHGHLDLLERLEDGHVVVAADERGDDLAHQRRVEKVAR
jgi:hypothetical protein